MQPIIRRIIIDNIPVEASPSLSRAEITKLLQEINRDWNWEGRQLGRVELIRDVQCVHIHAYEKPSIQIIPIKSYKGVKPCNCYID
ncbi:hypothetical protein M7775_14580 [Sporomusa sphaeroides DSM 2875]|uniref:hypothetical protein n=1 Tax=Sporomusa sphaeroides TaxID=47679 RepID=UPI00202EFB66|nr:hypothetical protein [Sporomusa sphaeroides]MCM0759783.1 hypothetical protein [Sporomusa sphaeroides DSM 2875]